MALRRFQLTLAILLPALLAVTIGRGVVVAAVEPSVQGEAAVEVVRSGGQAAADTACSRALELLQQQNSLLTRELAQLKRELALLRESIGKPGLKEIFSGIGYILGLAGIGFFAHCRAQQHKTEPATRPGD